MTEEPIDLIERWLEGRLPVQEAAAVQQRYDSDPAFQEKVDSYRLARIAISAHGHQQLKAALAQAYHAGGPVRRPGWVYAAAAAITLLILAGIGWRYWRQPATPQALYAEYFTPLPLRGLRNNSDIWGQAGQAYQRQAYEQAIPLFEALLADTAFAFADQARLYLAVSHMAEARPAAAIKVLHRISPISGAWAEAQWLLTLAYLAEGQLEQAQATLYQMQTQQPTYRQAEVEQLARSITKIIP